MAVTLESQIVELVFKAHHRESIRLRLSLDGVDQKVFAGALDLAVQKGILKYDGKIGKVSIAYILTGKGNEFHQALCESAKRYLEGKPDTTKPGKTPLDNSYVLGFKPSSQKP